MQTGKRHPLIEKETEHHDPYEEDHYIEKFERSLSLVLDSFGDIPLALCHMFSHLFPTHRHPPRKPAQTGRQVAAQPSGVGVPRVSCGESSGNGNGWSDMEW